MMLKAYNTSLVPDKVSECTRCYGMMFIEQGGDTVDCHVCEGKGEIIENKCDDIKFSDIMTEIMFEKSDFYNSYITRQMSETIKAIGKIFFHDIFIAVYHDPYGGNTVTWQERNPDTAYQGIMYINNHTGKVTYPDGEPEERMPVDTEIMPKFIIISEKVMTDEMICDMKKYLEKEYKRRNKL